MPRCCRMQISSVLVVACMFLTAQQISAQKHLVCYYASWATYRPGFGQFGVDHIDANLCTHLIYSFVGLNTDGTINVMDPLNDLATNGGRGGFQRFNKLREVNRNLKTLVAIGGWNEGSTVFSEIAMNAVVRARFVTNVFNFVRTHGFSGLDVDWEFPAQRGGAAADKTNFVLLLQELKARFEPAGLLLTIAVSASVWATTNSYDVPRIASTVDLINLMTYDFHGSWEARTGFNSPLYATSVDQDRTLNADATVRQWLRAGAPANKLVLGMATYARTYTLMNANSPGVGAPTTGPGYSGRYTQEASFLGYNEVCELQQGGGWSVNWAAQAKVPFTFQGTMWVGYENTQSLRIKAEYVKLLGLGGAMVWTIDTDDFRGRCGAGKYPLLNAIKTSLSASGVSSDANPLPSVASRPSTVNWFTDPSTTTTRGTTTTTRSPTTTTRSTTTTRGPTTTTRNPTTTRATTKGPTSPSTFTCQAPGYFRDPVNCSVYYFCQLGGSGYVRSDLTCPTGLYYDTARALCDWRANVSCP